MSGYVWYSFGSDTTGKSLAEALGFASGKNTPNIQEHEVILGWGCKPGTKYDSDQFRQAVASGQIRVLNAVEDIENNRRKLFTLKKLQEAGVAVPGFVESIVGINRTEFQSRVLKALSDGEIDLPLLCMEETHRGEPFLCYTYEDIAAAVAEMDTTSQYYFRSLCPGTEYRIHVFRDTAILGQIKVRDENPKESVAASLRGKLKKNTPKGTKLDSTTQDLVFGLVIPEILRGPAQILRSVGRGWKLEDISLQEIDERIILTAIEALEASGLDLGAISITVEGEAIRVTGIASAPALTDTHLGVYTAVLQEFCQAKKDDKGATKIGEAAKKKTEQASPELLASLTRRIRSLSKKEAEDFLKNLSKKG